MVTTTEVTLHKCNRTRYNRSLIAPQLALLVGLMLVNCSDSLRSNLNIEFGTVHPAFHEVLDETNSLLSKFPPLTHSHDAIRFTMLQSQNHSMDASTEFSPTLVNASKNATFEESSNASMFWFVSMESTQEPVITLFPSLKGNLQQGTITYYRLRLFGEIVIEGTEKEYRLRCWMCLVVFFAFWFGLLVLELRQERVELTAKCCKLEDLNSKFKDLSWKLYIDLRNVDANSKCMGGDSGLSDDSTDSRSCNSEYAPSADGEESDCDGTDSGRSNSETTRSSADDDESVCRSDTMTNDDSPGLERNVHCLRGGASPDPGGRLVEAATAAWTCNRR